MLQNPIKVYNKVKISTLLTTDIPNIERGQVYRSFSILILNLGLECLEVRKKEKKKKKRSYKSQDQR